MSDLTRYRDHCHAMATAEHKPECPSLGLAVPHDWPYVDPPPRPTCPGCNPESDRLLFALLAAEVDEYLYRPVEVVDLFGEAAVEPEAVEP